MTAVSAEPVMTITNVQPVDDAGSVHFECTMTARRLVDMVEAGELKLENNIRPDHMGGRQAGQKTKRKIETWAGELLQNSAVIGNISIRLDPTKGHFTIEEDDDGQLDLVVHRGHFDTGVDSESRIKAILRAAASPVASFKPETKFAVRVWVLSDDKAKMVASIYNTRGDKVNDSAAKYAWQQTAEQRLARMVMEKSHHLGQDNIEVLTNTVSGSSHKLAAFNTLAQAVDAFWQGEPLNEHQEEEQTDWLVTFWDELVQVRPEYGRLAKAQRQAQRDHSISGTAISIHGVVAAASTMYKHNIDPASVLPALKDTVELGPSEGFPEGTILDYFDKDNPLWVKLSVLTPAPDKDGNERKQLRMSFQTRREMAMELRRKLGLPKE